MNKKNNITTNTLNDIRLNLFITASLSFEVLTQGKLTTYDKGLTAKQNLRG